jgi:lipoprotein-anchoring transpeptidase ErfK/SrfK
LIPPERQGDYQDWLAQLPENLRGNADYDLQGAFLKGAKPEAGHLTDEFKKPNHMTFSSDSQYSGRNGEVGGRWVKKPDGSWTFYASPTNLKYHSPEELQDYFRRVEPGNTLVLPSALTGYPSIGGEPPVPKLRPPEPDSELMGFATRMAARQQPLRPFTPPESALGETGLPSLFGEPPVPSAPQHSPSKQILRAIGVSEPRHKTLEPQVARTFPKAVSPAKPTTAPDQSATPPKTFRATPSTVESAFKFSPLRQSEAMTGRKVVVSLPDKKVVVYDKNGNILREYSAYIGRASTPTPRGQFRIMENIKPAESEWYYGGHWLGFARDYQKYKGEPPPYAGFHGWVYDKQDEQMERVDPGWKTSTGGCIQLSNKDVADLASLLGAGDPVTVLDTPFAPPPARLRTPQLTPVGVAGMLQSLIPWMR